LLGRAPFAQGVRAFERNAHADAVGSGRGARIAGEDSAAIVLEGFVYLPDGALAEGAVVVSSAGGRAVADAHGAFRLERRRAAFHRLSISTIPSPCDSSRASGSSASLSWS
jgi:hypothetical protein